jgi:nicotinamidase-related amidase
MTKETEAFLGWLAGWEQNLPSSGLEDVVSEPARVALVVEDLVEGFCSQGTLASPRVAGVVDSAARLLRRAYNLGVRNFLFPQDTHDPDALEFAAFPPHCVAGTEESQTVRELIHLPFSGIFKVFPKNSISPSIGTEFDVWLEAHPGVTTFIVIGDCTDICVYQAALHLRMRANALRQPGARIVVPADAVQTYDLAVDTAFELGAMPHDGDLMHRVFLYHMALNGIEVVAHLT